MGARWRKKRRFEARALLLVAALAFALGLGFGAVWPYLLMQNSGEVAWSAENVREASVDIAAVRSDGLGVMANLMVKISPGDGRILVDTHPLVGFDFQYADRIAVRVASRFTGIVLDDDGVGLEGADILFVVSTTGGEGVEIQAIDGPSAGAAATVATIAAIENREVRKDAVITGTINEDGSIGPVGGIFQKAQAANEAGAELFLVPHGQGVLTMYREVTRQIGPFRWVTYEPVIVDLNEYAENAGWDVQIQEVSTIDEALSLMLE
jgi:uncharacterized protein